jgi:folate-binding protein YgfZ
MLGYNRKSMRAVTQNEQKVADSAGIRLEFHALVSGCGIYRPDRALVSLTGADRVRWLNGMVTNNVRDLAVGHGVYAFVLNPQGHIQADIYAFNRAQSLLVETEGAQLEGLLEIFDRYIIMDDVEVEDLTGKVQVVAITGPKSEETLAAAGWNAAGLSPLQIIDVQQSGLRATLVRDDNYCVPSYELWVSGNDGDSAWNLLLEAGAQEIHGETLETFRVACGTPKLGVDIRQRDLPQETGQDRALNFSKGCYIGQEIVERIRSRGAVHRTLVGFEFEGPPASPGTRVQSDGKDVGEITSVAAIPAGGNSPVVALGYLRKEFMSLDKTLTAGDSKLRVTALPFLPALKAETGQ